MAIDGKYGRVETEFGAIGEDEPVVVFRAQDGTLPRMLSHYRIVCEQEGSPPRHLEIIDDAIARVREWQGEPQNYVRRPPTSEGAAGRRYSRWRGETTADGNPPAVDPYSLPALIDFIHVAWGVIANAGGWHPHDAGASPGWKEAAERWRDQHDDLMREWYRSRHGKPADG